MRYWILVSFFITSQAFAVSFFDSLKTCVFSEVKAHLLLNGQPVANARVTRQWNWSEPKSDQALTDENGYVYFPAVFESSISRLLPIEVVVGQQLSVVIKGEKKIFWSNAKREAEENSEFGGAPFSVVCELSDEEYLIRDYGSLTVTMCKLQQEEQK